MIDRKIDDGSGSHHSRYASTSPRSTNASMSSLAASRTRGSSSAIFFGVNTGSRILRHFVCSAPSSSSGIATWRPLKPDRLAVVALQQPHVGAELAHVARARERLDVAHPAERDHAGRHLLDALASFSTCNCWGWSLVSAANSSASPANDP